MVEDLRELGRLTDVNLAGAWVNIGGHGGEVGGSSECPFVATGLPAAFLNGVYATGPADDPDQLIVEATAFMAESGVLSDSELLNPTTSAAAVGLRHCIFLCQWPPELATDTDRAALENGIKLKLTRPGARRSAQRPRRQTSGPPTAGR